MKTALVVIGVVGGVFSIGVITINAVLYSALFYKLKKMKWDGYRL